MILGWKSWINSRQPSHSMSFPRRKCLCLGGREGIGVGKIWEQGALDVGGDVYINNALAGYVVESTPMQTVDGFVFQMGRRFV